MDCTAVSEVLQAALDYAAAGYPVFPVHYCTDGECSCGNPECRSPGKHPLTQNGFKDATKDERVIAEWFTRWPDANIGMSTEGLLVVDVDPEVADSFVEHFSDVEFGGWQETPRHGVHMVFDGGGHGCRCSAGKVALHVDIRADGGYIVVAPSQVNGSSYAWVEPLLPRDQLPAPPDWLVERVKGRSEPQPAAPSVNGKWHEGVRNDQLFSTACRLGHGGLGPEVLESNLQAVNELSCDPPLDRTEVARIARSAANYSGTNTVTPHSQAGVPIDHHAGNGRYHALSNREPIDYAPITAAELAHREYSVTWLVDYFLAEGQPAILSGPKKALKTSIALDLVVSLASGTKFMGQFEVPQPRRVAFMSGESGMSVLQETLMRICRAKEVDVGELVHLYVTEQLPLIGDLRHGMAMERFIRQQELDVCIIDPAYLAMAGSDVGNLFNVGQRLRTLSDLTARTGCSFVLLHHTRKQTGVEQYVMPELDHMAWAGFQEWARQWIMLNRREAYEPGTGVHRLWLSYGGSAGHSGAWGVDIEEGTRKPTASRTWEVEVRPVEEIRSEQADHRQLATREKQSRRIEEDAMKIFDALGENPEGLTKNRLKDCCGLSSARVTSAISFALEEEWIVCTEIPATNRKTPYDGFKCRPDLLDEETPIGADGTLGIDQADQCPDCVGHPGSRTPYI